MIIVVDTNILINFPAVTSKFGSINFYAVS